MKDKSSRTMLLILGIAGALAITFGAFGAHLLKSKLTIDRLEIYRTGVAYHFYGLILLATSYILYQANSSIKLVRSFYTGLMGMILFSGSVYLLACRTLLNIESWTWLGPITPIGGLLMILGWLLLAFSSVKKA